MKKLIIGAVLVVLVLTLSPSARGATDTWTDGAGDDLWSRLLNWSNGLPAGNDVVFSDTGASSTLGTATSIVDAAYSINSLTFNNTYGWYQYLYFQPGTSLNTQSVTVNNRASASLGSSSALINTAYVSINNGAINVNSGATLDITSNLLLGYCVDQSTATAALNLAPGAGLHVGTAANPASMTVAQRLGGSGSTTAGFAPDSARNPDIALYLSTLNIGVRSTASGTVDLTQYTGPLSIQTLNVGDQSGGYGNFTFGNAVNNRLNVPILNIIKGDMTVNSGATLDVSNALNISLEGSMAITVGGSASGLVIENPSGSAMMLAAGVDRISLLFEDPKSPSEAYWGLLWKGDHLAQLTAWLNSHQINAGLTGNILNLDDVKVSLINQMGTQYTYVGFENVVPEPATLSLLAIGGLAMLRRRKSA